eukprot:scaffold47159_cov65-Phaeocystis_antarctica.AAC.1
MHMHGGGRGLALLVGVRLRVRVRVGFRRWPGPRIACLDGGGRCARRAEDAIDEARDLSGRAGAEAQLVRRQGRLELALAHA